MSLHFPRLIPKGTKRNFHRNLTRKRSTRRSGDQFRVVRSSPRDRKTSRSGVPHPVFILFVAVWVYFCFAVCKTEHYLLAVFLIGLSVPAASIVSDAFDDTRRAMNLRRRKRALDAEEAAASDPDRPMRLEEIFSAEEHARARTQPVLRGDLEPTTNLESFGLAVLVIGIWVLITFIIGQVLVDSPRWIMLLTPQSLSLIVIGSVLSIPFIKGGRESVVRIAAED